MSGYILSNESLTPDQQGDDEDDLVGLLVLGVFIIVFIIVILVSSARKCPRCGKKALTKSMEKFMKSTHVPSLAIHEGTKKPSTINTSLPFNDLICNRRV